MIKINDTKNVSFTTSKNQKSEKKKSIEQKSVELSSSEALNSYGRAFVQSGKLSFKGKWADAREHLRQSTSLSDDLIVELLDLPEEQRQEAIQLYEEGDVPENYVIDIVTANEEIKPKLKEVIKRGIEAKNAFGYNIKHRLADSEDVDLNSQEINARYDKIISWLDSGIDADTINTMIDAFYDFDKIDEKSIKRISEYLARLYSSQEFLLANATSFGLSYDEIADFSDEEYEKFNSLLDKGLLKLDLIIEMVQDENKQNRAEELLALGYSEQDTETLLDIEDKSLFKKTVDMMKKYSIPAYRAKMLLTKYEGQDLEKAAELATFTPYCDSFMKLPQGLSDRTLEFLKEGLITPDEVENLIISAFYLGRVDEETIKKIQGFLDEIESKNEKLDSLIKETKNGQYEEQLDRKDRNFLRNQVFESEYYTPEEYIELYLKLKNLKTVNGENILGCQAFLDKAQKNGLGDFAAVEEGYLNKNIETILSYDPNSKKMEYLKSILALIQMGKINPSALRKLSDLNELSGLIEMLMGARQGNLQNTTWEISNNLRSDIDLVFGEGTTSENWIDKYIPSYEDEKEGIEKSKIGEAFVLKGERYIRLKTDEANSKPIKLTKETYARLFPPVERFLTTQQIMGNCYCIEPLMSLYCDENTRVKLLEKMEEDEKGNIKIQFENYKPVVFENGSLPALEDETIYSRGADGYKLFEYAYSCALVEDKIKEAKEALSGEKLAEFIDFINSNPDNFYIQINGSEVKWEKYSEFKKKQASKGAFLSQPYNTYNNFLLGNGGMQNEVYRKFGYTSTIYDGGELFSPSVSKNNKIRTYKKQGFAVDDIGEVKQVKRFLKDPSFFKGRQIQIGLGMHAYGLTSEKDDEGNMKFYLYNPHNQGFPIKFDNIEYLLNKVSQVTVVNMN